MGSIAFGYNDDMLAPRKRDMEVRDLSGYPLNHRILSMLLPRTGIYQYVRQRKKYTVRWHRKFRMCALGTHPR